MQTDYQSNFHFYRNRLSRAGSVLMTLLFFFSVVVSSVRADTSTPTAPDAPIETAANVLSSSIFGVQMWPMNAQGGLNSIAGTPTRWVRGPEILWKNVQPTKTTFDWSAIDQAVIDIQNANSVYPGSSVIVIIRSTPTWAQANPPFSCGPIKPSEYQSFGNFIFALISELSNRGINYVKYWEIWNEPDNPPISSNDPDQPWGGCWGTIGDAYFGGGPYGNMLKAIYPIVKTKDPNAQILVGGLNLDCDPRFPPPAGHTDCNSSKFLEGILQAGAGNSFDGISFHAFDYITKDQGGAYLLGQFSNTNWPGASWNESGPSLVAKSMFIRSVLQKYNITGKYLMNTENSLLDAPNSTYEDPYPPILETTKSFYVAKAYAAALANGLKANIWFDVTGSWLRNNGLVKLDNSAELDAYHAYEFAANKSGNPNSPAYTASFSYVGGLSFPGVAGYEFAWYPAANPNNLVPSHIWFLWSTDNASHIIKFPFTSWAAFDVKGNPVTPNPDQTLTIYSQPYYVEVPPVVIRDRLPMVMQMIMPLGFNGDFERGFQFWMINNGGLPTTLQITSPYDPRDPSLQTNDLFIPKGTASALLGDPNYGLGQAKGSCIFPNIPFPAYAGLNKVISVPSVPAGQNVSLQFNYIIYTQDTTGPRYDRFVLSITDLSIPSSQPVEVFADGNKVFQYADICRWYRVPSNENPGPNSETSGWAMKRISLNNYRGKQINISFKNISDFDGWYNTYTYLDDVQIVLGP